ncbi:MAG: TonB-dependent receptor [Deltaproteobacteria bacterium]|nr:TonB-dependent receptor [Deltaproteobacteria bacterium]
MRRALIRGLAVALLLGSTAGGAALAAPPAVEKITPPQLLAEVAPRYPEVMAARRLRGVVVVQIDVGIDGSVGKASIVQSAGPAFDASALEAARALRFVPATRGGTPIAVRIHYRFVFDPATAGLRRGKAGGLGRFDRRGHERAPSGFRSLVGRVIERGTNRPIAGATILLPKSGETTISEGDGSFEFGVLEPGSWTVRVIAVDHKQQSVSVPIQAGKTATIELRVERESYVVYRATAVAPPAPGEMARRELSAEEIQRVPGVYGDAFKVVQNLPGVARAPAISGDIIVRGAAPGDTQILIDGVRVPILYHFGGLYSVMNTDLLEGIDFYPGGYTARYGRKTGGVLEARLRVPRKDEGAHGYVESNVFHTGALLRFPVGEDTHIAIAARRSYIDLVLAAVIPDGALPFTLAPRYWDYQLKVDHRFSDKLDATLLVLGSDDRLSLVVDRPPPGFGDANAELSTSIGFHGAMALLRWNGGGIAMRTTLGVLRAGLNFGFGETFRVDANSWQLDLRHDVRVGPGQPIELRFGLDLYNEPYNAEVRLPPQAADVGSGADAEAGRRLFSLDTNLLQPAIWVDAVFRMHPRLEVVPGVRLDLYRDALQGETALPRLNVRFRASETLTLKAATGVLSQAPDPEQVVARFGNPNLLPFRSWEVSAGAEWSVGERLTLDVQGFHKQLWDRVVGPREPWRGLAWENAGRGRIVGLEVLARHRPIGRFFGWIAYTLMRGTEIPHPGETERLLPWDQTHILTAVGSWKLPWNLEFSTRFRLVSGNPYTDVATAVYDANDDGFQRVQSACLQCARLPRFQQWDLRVDRKWVFDRWMLGAYLDVQNVTNRSNPEGLNYNFDATRKAYQSLLPIIPSLGLRGEF